jgi:hypothetical protein
VRDRQPFMGGSTAFEVEYPRQRATLDHPMPGGDHPETGPPQAGRGKMRARRRAPPAHGKIVALVLGQSAAVFSYEIVGRLIELARQMLVFQPEFPVCISK